MKPVDSTTISGHSQQAISELRGPTGWACVAKSARKAENSQIILKANTSFVVLARGETACFPPEKVKEM